MSARPAPSGPGPCALSQCREGWHLEDEPDLTPDPATEDQQWWVTMRAEAQQLRDQADEDGQDTADFDELIRELDEEITRSGVRGNVLPAGKPARRHRSTRRRQDAPDLPRRQVSPRTVGKTYTAPDGKTFRPSMFVTLTCPSYGRVDHHGVPVDPAAYDYDQAARDALTFAALFDRFIQNLRRYLGHDLQYFAAVEPQRRLAPHIHIAIRGTIARSELRRVLAATYHQVWWPDTGVKYGDGDQLPVWHDQAGGTSTRPPGRCCRPGMRPWTPSAPYDLPWHVARFGDRFDAQGVLAGSPDAARCIGYLTKYLTKQVGGCHQAATGAQQRSRRPAGRGAAVPAVLAAVRQLAAVRHPAQERPARPGAWPVQGQGPRRRSPRLRRAPGPGLPQVVRQDPGRPPRRPEGVAAADPRCFGNRPGPVRLGTRRPVRSGPHGTRPADAARRRRPAPMADSTSGGQTQGRDATGR